MSSGLGNIDVSSADGSFVVGILGIISGVVMAAFGIICGYVFYRRGLRLQKPSWDIRSNNIIHSAMTKIPNLHIAYGSGPAGAQPIKNLTVSTIFIWNAGNRAIDFRDIAEGEPLRIEVQGEGEILQAALRKDSRPRISEFAEPVLAADRKSASLRCATLESSQYAVFEVTHTGVSSADISVQGHVKDTGPFTRISIRQVTGLKEKMQAGILIVPVLFTVFFLPSLLSRQELSQTTVPTLFGETSLLSAFLSSATIATVVALIVSVGFPLAKLRSYVAVHGVVGSREGMGWPSCWAEQTAVR